MMYQLYEEGDYHSTVDAADMDEALEIAASNVDADNYPKAEKTFWVLVEARLAADETVWDTRSVAVDPPEPPCEENEGGHDWSDDHALVGGCRSNPGVFAHGGGAWWLHQCTHCGMRRINDSWAQNPETGEQGLDSVRYEEVL